MSAAKRPREEASAAASVPSSSSSSSSSSGAARSSPVSAPAPPAPKRVRKPAVPKMEVYCIIKEAMRASSRRHSHTMKVMGVYEDLHAANLACLNQKGVSGSGVGMRDGLVKYMSYPDSNSMDRIYVQRTTAWGLRNTDAEVQAKLRELKDDDDDDYDNLESAESQWEHHYG